LGGLKPLVLSLILVALVSASTITVAGQPRQGQGIFEEPRYIVRPTGFGFSLLVGGGRAGPLKVIYISGNPYDRGFEYGYLAAEEISGVLNWAYNLLGKALGAPPEAFREKLLAMAEEYEPYIPQEYLDEMRGVADGFNSYAAENPSVSLGFNLTYLDILMINSFVDFTCTGAVISGNLTIDGYPILGTTIDAPPLAPYFIYVVERPESGHQIAYFTAAGSLFQNGFNDAGLGMIEHHIHDWKGVVGMPEMIRDRYVLQYADNVTQAINMFEELLREYGFSGYGDDVGLADRYGNIAKLEVTPYRIGVIVNPDKDPTWPPEDPFLRTSAFGMPIPTNYVVFYKVGYSNVLRGRGWIVNGLYTLNETVVGLPGFPKTWKEATTSKNYTWLWEAPERYMIAHYIYDKQLRGEKFSLLDGIVMSQLPLVGDTPYDDGAIWMEPALGIAVILKGQSSLVEPVWLQTFYPIPTARPHKAPVTPLAPKILNNTVTIIQLARQIRDAIDNLSTGNAKALQAINDMLNTLSQELAANSKALQDSIGILAAQVTANLKAINAVNETCSKLAISQEAISNQLGALSSNINNLNQGVNTLENSSSAINTKLDMIKNYTHKIEALTISTLAIALVILGITAFLAAKRT
jgi:hypothetical protein